jgi:hypothetical protein
MLVYFVRSTQFSVHNDEKVIEIAVAKTGQYIKFQIKWLSLFSRDSKTLVFNLACAYLGGTRKHLMVYEKLIKKKFREKR